MMRRMRVGVVGAGFAVFAAFAQAQSGIEAPTLGFVFDRASAAILPITGVPGAAMYGAPLLTSIDGASVAPSGDLAIVRNSDGVFAVKSLRDATPEWTRLGDGDTFLAAWGKDSGVVWAASAGFSVWTRVLVAGSASWTSTPVNPGLPEGSLVSIDYDETELAKEADEKIRTFQRDAARGVLTRQLLESLANSQEPLH